MVVRALLYLSATYSAVLAFLLPLSARFLRRILLTDENAVSVDEKNAESKSNTTQMAIVDQGSKNHHSK